MVAREMDCFLGELAKWPAGQKATIVLLGELAEIGGMKDEWRQLGARQI
jgi:hypothetical protein